MTIRTNDYNHDISISDWLRDFEFNPDGVSCREYDHDEQTYKNSKVNVSQLGEVFYTLACTIAEQQTEISELKKRLDTLSKHVAWETEP